MRRHISQAIALIPNAITLGAICCGLTAMKLAHEGNYTWAIGAIFMAALLDFVDGFVARRLQAHSAIGAELDTLADFVNFGIAPAFILYLWELHQIGGLGWALCAGYAIATGLRLARFNVMSRSSGAGLPKNTFEGLPSTCAATIVLAAPLMMRAVLPSPYLIAAIVMLLAAASLLMLSRYPIPTLVTAARIMRTRLSGGV